MPAVHYQTPDVTNTVFLVLCGGRGTRMGGRDKPLLTWRGKAMVDHVLDSVPPQMARLISANRNLAAYAQRTTVIEDGAIKEGTLPGRGDFPDGPLLGILAGLHYLAEQTTCAWLLVSPGDTPALPTDWWQRMRETACVEGVSAVVAFDGQRQQHLHVLLHVSLLDALHGYLQRGEFAVHAWLTEINARRADIGDPDAFRNINRPEDLES